MAICDVRLSFPATLYTLNSILVHLERIGSLEEDAVCFYVAQLSSALSFIHDMGIMHRLVLLPFRDFLMSILPFSYVNFRDIKPDNILLDEKGNAHLTDFNIAVHFSERKITGVAGSMAYMAPE